MIRAPQHFSLILICDVKNARSHVLALVRWQLRHCHFLNSSPLFITLSMPCRSHAASRRFTWTSKLKQKKHLEENKIEMRARAAGGYVTIFHVAFMASDVEQQSSRSAKFRCCFVYLYRSPLNMRFFLVTISNPTKKKSKINWDDDRSLLLISPVPLNKLLGK